MAINYTTGEVTCNRCGITLGNYNVGDYFSLIRLKYCPACRAAATKEQRRVWAQNRRVHDRLVKKQEKDNLNLLREENELLRERIKELMYKGV